MDIFNILSGLKWSFLKNVVNEASGRVVEVISKIPKTDNPRFYEDVIDIALQVEAPISIKLKPRILEYIRGKYPFLHPRFEKVLCYWTENEQVESALELTEALIKFHPDPLATDKQARREQNPEDWTTSLEPQPRFRYWEYKEILEKGVRPLSGKAPYQASQILIDATANMIYLQLHREQLEKIGSKDGLMLWCDRVNEPSEYKASEVSLVNTLTFACEKVYEKAPESVAALNEALCNERWDIFKRIRQHLYAKFPEQTRPWIHDMIFDHPDYGKWEHQFEFQRIIRLACEHFGADLLTEAERTQIFEAILNGPSEQSFRDWMGEDFTEEAFEKRKRYFHWKQLRPFAPVLFGKYADYFEELNAEEKPVTDDDYAPHKSEGGVVGRRSPKSIDELKEMPDEEILSFLNEWENVGHAPDDWLMEITFEALAEAFREIFPESIIVDESRLRFWIENKHRIERPIYVRAMVSAIHEHVKLKQFDSLDVWFNFCEWVLSHPDQPKEEGVNRSDESKTHPDWSSSRRAVGDFVEMCLKWEIDVPISARKRLYCLLDKLCTQYDGGLDDEESALFYGGDSMTAAINNTRSQALESLIDFGYWVRRQEDDQADTPEVFTILEKRIGPESEHPLTLPEHALLGLHYVPIFGLNREWATRCKDNFFPKDNLRAWGEAFRYFLTYKPKYNPLHKPTFDVIRDEYEFALNNLRELEADSLRTLNLVDKIGERLFTYYLQEVYPLTGNESLLERFFERTRQDKERWSHLFDDVGRRLKNSGRRLDEDIERNIIAFFDWRLEEEEASELKEFSFWMEAECLDPEWRLKSYSKILDLYESEEIRTYTQLESLRGMLEGHTALVVECLTKLTDLAVKSGGNPYFHHIKQARPILLAGLNSNDPTVRENAERARENLLRSGYLEFSNLED